jgi:hypothetical protein
VIVDVCYINANRRASVGEEGAKVEVIATSKAAARGEGRECLPTRDGVHCVRARSGVIPRHSE